MLSDPVARAAYDQRNAAGDRGGAQGDSSADGAAGRDGAVPPSWDAAVRTFARAMESAGDRLGGLKRNLGGGDLAVHALGRAVAHTATEFAVGAATRAAATELAEGAAKGAAAATARAGAARASEAVAGAVIRTEVQASLAAGERLTASAVSKGVGARMIPLLGAVVSGAIDAATTARTGAAARRAFSRGEGAW